MLGRDIPAPSGEVKARDHAAAILNDQAATRAHLDLAPPN
jgi:hypothetical protein